MFYINDILVTGADDERKNGYYTFINRINATMFHP